MGCDTSQTDQSRFHYLKAIALFVMLLLCIHQAGGWCVPNEWAKILASDGAQNDYFGFSTSISGNLALVGAYGDDDNGAESGSAYIFNSITGQQLFKLMSNDGAAGDQFGWSVSISGANAIIGAFGDDDNGHASGSAYIFDTNTGLQTDKLLPSDGETGDYFGYSVSISGTTAVVGAYRDSDNGAYSGSAYIFRFNGSTWVQEAKLLAGDGSAVDYFGWSVAISGTTAIIGATGDDDNGLSSGSAYLFDTATGMQIGEKLLPSDGDEEDQFGYSVAISGMNAVIGASWDDEFGYWSGSAYLFDTISGNQITKLLASDAARDDRFGESVAISGDTVIIGAFHEDCPSGGTNCGSAYAFQYNGLTWEEEAKLSSSDRYPRDNFGISVAINNATAVIGARFENDSGGSYGSGSAYIFHGLGDLNENGIIDICDIDFDGPVEIASIGDPTDVVSIDFTGDESNDIAIAELGATPSDPGYIKILINDGTGVNFPIQQPTGVGREPTAFAVADFDGINGPDAAVTNSGDDDVTILLNDGNGTGTFGPRVDVPVGDNPSDITSGDFNGDTFIDLAVTNKDDNNVKLLFNDGNGNFTPQPPFAVGGAPSSIVAGTFDNNSTIDLIIACEGDDTVRVYTNDGTGGYTLIHTIIVGPDPGALDPEDLDGDNDLDVMVVNRASGFITYLLNDGAGNFTRFDEPIGMDPSSIDAADLDYDGDMDLIVAAGVDDTRAVRILRNDMVRGGGLNFTLVQDVAEDPDLKLTTAKDLDDDDLPDIIAVNGPNQRKHGKGGNPGTVDVLINALRDPCAADITEDDVVNIDDIFAILGLWGDCSDPCPPYCDSDLTEDCTVNIDDIFYILGEWGPCE